MKYRSFWVLPAIFCLCFSVPGLAQLSRDARYDLLRTVMADQAAARIGLPFGTDGVELSDSGQINQEKLQKEIQKNGQSIQPGKVVSITDMSFDDNKITLELDGGGKNKKSVLDRIQIGVGGNAGTVPVRDDKV